jgi:hypothetical protein
VDRRCTRFDRSFTARLRGSPRPRPVSTSSPSGCSTGSRANSTASRRSVPYGTACQVCREACCWMTLGRARARGLAMCAPEQATGTRGRGGAPAAKRGRTTSTLGWRLLRHTSVAGWWRGPGSEVGVTRRGRLARPTANLVFAGGRHAVCDPQDGAPDLERCGCGDSRRKDRTGGLPATAVPGRVTEISRSAVPEIHRPERSDRDADARRASTAHGVDGGGVANRRSGRPRYSSDEPLTTCG